MTQTRTYASFRLEGSAALRPAYRELTLIEGGRRPAEGASCRHARAARPEGPAARFSAAQVVAAVAVTVSLMLALGVAWVLSSASVSRKLGHALEHIPASSVVVRPGDSLWGLAEEHAVEGYSTQELVSWMEQRNGLAGATLVPGQELLVPASVG